MILKNEIHQKLPTFSNKKLKLSVTKFKGNKSREHRIVNRFTVSEKLKLGSGN